MNSRSQEGSSAGESLIVLTMDDSLVVTLESVASNRPLAVIGTEADLPAYLIGDHAGVAIIDTAAISTPIQKLTDRLASQFPDLILVVAGDSRDQAALSAQVTRGTVYRFLHKPASPQRVKLFVDAAWRRREEGYSPMTADRARSNAAPSDPRIPRNILIYGLSAVVIAVGIAVYKDMQPAKQAPITASRTSSKPAARASQPPQRVQTPSEPDPRLEPLLSRAEQALFAGRIDDSERLVNQAQAMEPNNARVVFLDAQIKKERERAALSTERGAAAAGNIDRAVGALDDARRSAGESPPVNGARQDLAQQLNRRVANLLALAEDRIRTGLLIEPAQDNARFYVESAAAIAPDDPAVRNAEQDLADRLLARGKSALAAGNSDDGERWLAAAADAGAAANDITSIRRDIAGARINTKADTMARLAQLFNQRLSQGRLMDSTDSARTYLTQLEQWDSSHPSTRLARVSLSGRLLEEARLSTRRGDLVAAQNFVSNARGLGANSVNAAAIEREIAAARDRTGRSVDAIISAGRLERTKYVPPDYPVEARQNGLSGSVELTFTVRTDGRVTDVNVERSTPADVFNDAAIDAVSKWRYRPFERDGQAVDQRVKLVLRFAME